MRVSTAAFVVYWLGVSVSAQTKGQPPPATPPDANAAAALNCRALGARGALPNPEEVEHLLLARPHM